MTVYKKIPNRLRKHRRIIGYTQKQVAQRLKLKGVGRISQWENGARFPGIRNLIKLSILYRTLVDELYYDLREVIRKDLDCYGSELEEAIFDKHLQSSNRKR